MSDIICEKVEKLLALPVLEQRSMQWFLARKEKITASEVASCLFKNTECCLEYVKDFNITDFKYDNKGCNSFETYPEYIIKKCSPYKPFPDTIHTLWGKKYEESALRLYKLMTKKKVLEFGLLPHYENDWLGASPDGISTDGIMLEIKVPKTRKIKQGTMPFGYYTQVQVQMECCDLDQCDFLECEIAEINKNQFFKKSEITMFDGIIVMEKKTQLYHYPETDIITHQDFLEWIDTFLEADYEFTYYTITNYNFINVMRNRVWFDNVKETLKKTHDTIKHFQNDLIAFETYKQEYYYKLHTKHREMYEKTVMDESLMDSDDDTQTMVFCKETDSESDICVL
jgi:putative phage-type endonuclease